MILEPANITLQYPPMTHHLSSGQPEGLAILLFIAVFPFLFAYKGKIDFSKLIHEYMADTDFTISRLSRWLK